MAMGRWGQEMWLSDRDFLNGMLAAISAKDVPFAVLNLMSNNPGMRWDLSETQRTIGYTAQDGSRAQINWKISASSWLKKVTTVLLPQLMDRYFPNW